jgi:protein KIAA0825
MTGKTADLRKTLISALDKCQIKDWASCLDRRQVWNQKRAPWLEAILHFVYPVVSPIIHMMVSAFQGGATVYQTMALSVSCFSEMWDCIPDCFYVVTSLLTEIIPADIRPLGDSVLIHILFSALYTKILETSQEVLAIAKKTTTPGEASTSSDTNNSKSKVSICTILAEAICFIDEDNKHTEQIMQLINKAKDSQRTSDGEEFETMTGISLVSTSKADDLENRMHASPSTREGEEFDVENAEYMAEVLISEVLTSPVGKQSMKVRRTFKTQSQIIKSKSVLSHSDDLQIHQK